MPPVRWKLTAVTIYLFHISVTARTPKDISDDGWKPIIGHSPISNFDTENINYQQVNKIEKSPIITTFKPMDTLSTKAINSQYAGHSHPSKVSSTNKQQIMHYLARQAHTGQKILTHRSQTKLHKVPIIGKNHMSSGINGKHVVKPARGSIGAYSQKDEILAPAPSTGIGNYNFYTQSPNTKARYTQHPNTDFINHFSPQGNDLFQFQRVPIQQYVLPKTPLQNDLLFTFQAQNDEYTRNLVPPPPSKEYIDKEKSKNKLALLKQKELSPPGTGSLQINKQRVEQSQVLPETVLYQVPAPYQQTTYYVPQKSEQSVQVQVTKENIKELHNNIPYRQQNVYNYPFANYQFEKKPTETPRMPTYEVTEEKDWQEVPPSFQHQFQYEFKNSEKSRRPTVKQPIKADPFLPTPSKPSGVIPTSPTQSEISTVFSALSQKVIQKENVDPNFFSIKEVSTHYPILGKPSTSQFNLQYSIPVQDSINLPDEVTTIKPRNRHKLIDVKAQPEVETIAPETTPIPTRDWQQKRRPSHRRRRPINRNKPTTEESTTTTEDYDMQREIEQTTVKERRRRPIHMQRTTEVTAFIEKPVKRNRHRQRIRPTEETVEEDLPYNHKMLSIEHTSKPLRGSYAYKSSTENNKQANTRYKSYTNEDFINNEEYKASAKSKPIPTNESKLQHTNKYYLEEQDEENNYQVETINEETNAQIYENYRRKRPTTPPFEEFTTILSTTDNLEYTTKAKEVQDDRITIKEVYTETPEIIEEDTTLATTIATTTTTATTTTATTPNTQTTTKSNRFRRPIHYRPKFSVKDYHQRLNQYISSTETSKTSTEAPRSRLSYRTRRPILRQEEHKEESTERRKFVPKSQRQIVKSDMQDETTEEPTVKMINSRLRPFGRYRSTTTEATTTQKISIKPNLFNTLRRPPPLSLKERIQNKYNKSNTTEKINKTEENYEENENEVTTEVVPEIATTSELATTHKSTTTTILDDSTTEDSTSYEDFESEDVSDMDLLKNDAVLQSQRVSDLTSSTQNQYNTPGMFKSVSPNVRKVPNYFTIATEDPILPIEAFFPNINKDKL